MAKAAPHECTRCGGTGMTTHIRVHYGVPGLCFACDGDGKRETQVKNIEAAKRAKQIRALTEKADAEIRALAEQHGGQNLHLPYEKRRAFAFSEVFSTAQYAEKFNMKPKEAFIELARSWPHYRIWTDEQGQPKGWWYA
jgi:DnaJ-class molecular chaperone